MESKISEELRQIFMYGGLSEDQKVDAMFYLLGYGLKDNPAWDVREKIRKFIKKNMK